MIYLARCRDVYKIGYTASDPAKRIKSLQTGNPSRIELIGTVPGSYEEEDRLHVRFAAKRVSGEWFALDDEDVEYILSLNKPFDELSHDEKMERTWELAKKYPRQFTQLVKELRKTLGQ